MHYFSMTFFSDRLLERGRRQARFSQRQELRILALEYKDLYIIIIPGNPATHSSAVFQRLTGVLTAYELHDGCGGVVSIARGNVNVNVVPCPSTLSTLTCPPCAVTISRTM